jgi:hypothetical protein
VSVQNNGLLTFLAPFLGAFAAVIVIGVVGAGGYFAYHAFSSSSSSSSSNGKKNLLMDIASWQEGKDVAKNLDGNDKADVGWWTRHFDLPKQDVVMDYLKKQGLTVLRIEPAHYQTTPDSTIITYDVYAEVPAQLMHLQRVAWQPNEPDMRRFEQVLVLNNDLPAGSMWNTQNPTMAAEAGTKLNFAWKVNWDKTYNIVDTDRLPLSEGVFTQQQVSQYQDEANNTVMQLRGQIQQIDARVESDTQAKLAQVPADPPRPQMLSSKFGGDGSGEPTKSAERIGGGTLAGAAGGAAFGAAAGDAGLGAGIGAGVGLLGGLIYDGVSKSNDRKRHEGAVAAENEERLDDWREQIRDLKKQRAQIQQDAVAEKDKELTDLANRIAANGGKPDGTVSTQSGTITPPENSQPPVSDAPPVQPVTSQPTAEQPTGPIAANSLAAAPSAAAPVAVTVIDVTNPTHTKYDTGNIQVRYADGHTEQLTQDGKSTQPALSPQGLVGWVYLADKNKDLLAVRGLDGMIKSYAPNSMFVLNWGFVDDGNAVVIGSMQHHGPPYFIKYNLQTGNVLGRVDVYHKDSMPEWAKPFDL